MIKTLEINIDDVSSLVVAAGAERLAATQRGHWATAADYDRIHRELKKRLEDVGFWKRGNNNWRVTAGIWTS